jgi:hypothetical protein
MSKVRPTINIFNIITSYGEKRQLIATSSMEAACTEKVKAFRIYCNEFNGKLLFN